MEKDKIARKNRVLFRKTGAEISIMTFNTWNSGRNVENGFSKIAAAINEQNPDVVGLQEMYENAIEILIKLLHGNWQKCPKG